MAMGRPQRSSPIRIWRIVSACSACVPWEKFTRATSMPAVTSRSRSAAPLLAGPMVHTILVRRILLFLYIDIGGGAWPPPILLQFTGSADAARQYPSGASRCRRERSGSQRGLQELSRVRFRGLTRHRFRRAGGEHAAALLAPLGTEIDDPIGGFDHVQVVLDDHHGIALLDEPVQHLQQLLDVGEVQPRGRLVQDVERAAGGATTQLGGELHAL